MFARMKRRMLCGEISYIQEDCNIDNKGKGVSAGFGTIVHFTSHVSLTAFCSFSPSFLLMGVLPFQDVHLDRKFTKDRRCHFFGMLRTDIYVEVNCVTLPTWW